MMPRPVRGASLLLAALLAASACQARPLAERMVTAPVAARQSQESGLQTAIFAGGCFWGVEGVFSHVRGVTSAVSGYHGGRGLTAEYERVARGDTGHAESVRVTYDPAQVRYDQLLQVFFSVIADPTQLNRQGPDDGTQYRSALVPTSDEQRAVATAYLAQLSDARVWPGRIVTRIEPMRRFYPAEGYHQDYMLHHPDQAYIQTWDQPKLAEFASRFPGLYQPGFTPG
jgi:peptide-methionine (S)-S-oxide reductase